MDDRYASLSRRVWEGAMVRLCGVSSVLASFRESTERRRVQTAEQSTSRVPTIACLGFRATYSRSLRAPRKERELGAEITRTHS